MKTKDCNDSNSIFGGDTVNSRISLDINLKLQCGLEGNWEICWAKVHPVEIQPINSNLEEDPKVLKPKHSRDLGILTWIRPSLSGQLRRI